MKGAPETVTDGVTAQRAVAEQKAIKHLAARYDLDPNAFATTFRSVAMPNPHTLAEFVACCLVARDLGLNPLMREVYFGREKSGEIVTIVGYDGWVKKCNEHPAYDGVEFDDVFDGCDEIKSITTRIFRKDRSRPTAVTEYLAECQQPGTAHWTKSPARCLRNRSFAQCARLALGLGGIMLPDEAAPILMADSAPSAPAQPAKVAAHQENRSPAAIGAAAALATVEAVRAVAAVADVPTTRDPRQQTLFPGEDIPDEGDQLADVPGYLARLARLMRECVDEDERQKLASDEEPLISRLPQTDQVKARGILAAVE